MTHNFNFYVVEINHFDINLVGWYVRRRHYAYSGLTTSVISCSSTRTVTVLRQNICQMVSLQINK